MRSIVFCVLCLQVAWGYAYPGSSRGVGAYSFSDSSGQRYGGTYDVKDGKVVSSTGDFPAAGNFPAADNFQRAGNFPIGGNYPVPFADAYQGYGFAYGFPGDFFPSYFANLDGYLHDIRSRPAFVPPLPPLPPLQPMRPFQRHNPLRPLYSKRRAFDSNIEDQKLAFNAARKAFDLTSYQAGGYIPNFDYRFQPFNDMSGFNDFRSMPNFANSAFASAAAGPGYSHQIAAINPANPEMRNVDQVNQNSDTPSQGNFYSVSSKSYSSSANVNGQEKSARGAETTVNNNGKITQYKVQSSTPDPTSVSCANTSDTLKDLIQEF